MHAGELGLGLYGLKAFNFNVAIGRLVKNLVYRLVSDLGLALAGNRMCVNIWFLELIV